VVLVKPVLMVKVLPVIIHGLFNRLLHIVFFLLILAMNRNLQKFWVNG
jgi:hypothetical protein